MGIIAYILNIIKSLGHLKEIIKFISNNKGVAALFLLVSLSASILAENILKKYLHNRSYDVATELDNVSFILIGF